MAPQDVYDIIIRLLLAFILGGLVGFQRERAERPAGFRTHVLVAIGAAVFTIISISPFSNNPQGADPSRIASQVVIGIGFIGAGAIINQGDIILGLTTAASLWATAAIGMAVGDGLYVVALATTVIVYLILSVFKAFEKRVSPGMEHGTLFIELTGGKKQLKEVEKLLLETDILSKNFELTKEKELSEYRFYLELPPTIEPDDLLSSVLAIEGVQKARWEGILIGRSV